MERRQFILDVIISCKDPSITFTCVILTLEDELIPTLRMSRGCTKSNAQSCGHLTGMKSTGESFLKIPAIGHKHNFDYLLHLVDDYSRDRIKNIDRNWSEVEWSNEFTNKHFRFLKSVVKDDLKGTPRTFNSFVTICHQSVML